MAKKKRKNVAEDALSIAQNVWLAGLGALATTQEEGGKLFKRLVEKGEKVDFKGKSGLDEKVDKAREKVGEARERIEGQVDKAREAVSSAWGDLASSFDDQLGAALHRLGVPTRDEIKTLTARVEALIEKVGEKQAPKAPAAKKPAAKASSAAAKAKKPAAAAEKA